MIPGDAPLHTTPPLRTHGTIRRGGVAYYGSSQSVCDLRRYGASRGRRDASPIPYALLRLGKHLAGNALTETEQRIQIP